MPERRSRATIETARGRTEADRGGRCSSHTPLSLDQAVAVLRALDLAAAEEDEGGGTSLPPGRASNRR